MFELFRIVTNDAGEVYYKLGFWPLLVYVVSIVLCFIFGYILKLVLDTSAKKQSIQNEKDASLEIEKEKNLLEAQLEQLKQSNAEILELHKNNFNKQLQEYTTKLQEESEKILKQYQSSLDSISSLALRDEDVVRRVKVSTILTGNKIKIELYQELQNLRFELRDNRHKIECGVAYEEAYHKEIYRKSVIIKDKVFKNSMYLNALFNPFLRAAVAMNDLIGNISTPISGNVDLAGRIQREQLKLSTAIDQYMNDSFNIIVETMKPYLSLNDVDISKSQEEKTKEIRETIIPSETE